MKLQRRLFLICIVLIGFLVGFAQLAFAVKLSDEPIVVYGDALSTDQKEEVRRLLEVTDPEDVKELTVTGADIAKYIGGDPNSNMYSSVKIIGEDEGKGLTIHIVTADNITEVTTEMYRNALLTAGVEDATVEVASPIPVTGGSALSGIYKAYDEEGEGLDQERMEVASEELDLATDLSEREGLDQETVSELLAEIKKIIAEEKPATKEDVERIVKEQLDRLEITLSDEDREMLINLFDKMRDLDIDFNKVKNQLEDIASTIKEKVGDIDPSFWKKVENFFKQLIDALSGFFSKLFD